MIAVQAFLFIGLFLYTKCLKDLKPQNPCTRSSLKSVFNYENMKGHLKIGVPGSLFLMLEWGSF
jgi:hypothetical protein